MTCLHLFNVCGMTGDTYFVSNFMLENAKIVINFNLALKISWPLFNVNIFF